MIPHEAEVLSALILLSNTPYEIISNHQDLALRTLTNIRRALDSTCIAGADFPNNVEAEATGDTGEPRGYQGDITALEAQATPKDASSLPANSINAIPEDRPTDLQELEPSTLPECSSQSTQRKRKRQTAKYTPSAALIEAAKARLPQILDLCKSKASLSEILQTEQEMQFADKRIDHLKQVDGNKTPSDEQKLLKGLSQLSLAQQFTDWEFNRGWKPKSDMLYVESQSVEVESQATCAKSGKMSRFIRDHDYPKSDHNVVRKGIQKGLNQIVFLRLLNDNSTSSDHKKAAKGIIALVTIFQYALFQKLSILELPMLAKTLLHEGKHSEFIRDAQVVSPWFEHMSGDFEMISQTTKRGPRDTQAPANVPSHPVNWPAEVDTQARRLNGLLGQDERSVRERSIDAAQPSLTSHELTSFSTFPSHDSTLTRRPSNSAFVGIQYTPERTQVLPTAGSHDLAQFSKNTNNIDSTTTSDSVSRLMSHDLSMFSTAPSTVSFQQPLALPRTYSALAVDRCNPFSCFQDTPQAISHELSSFSTAPITDAVH
ncbi:hypothetical protein N7533_008390 [Penicillium manginii]|jgi:hypothetical protein|uniref:uncharacterized protein n=1 Tax=Penicillium manginii TaxID=203109 RepID=UPI002547F124|nr:uncharacterized protein N7533_008390 [Penicillium manginii]KAJ5751362.1 hypothetical protein N7533_008390 [Penicillium manginii]